MHIFCTSILLLYHQYHARYCLSRYFFWHIIEDPHFWPLEKMWLLTSVTLCGLEWPCWQICIFIINSNGHMSTCAKHWVHIYIDFDLWPLVTSIDLWWPWMFMEVKYYYITSSLAISHVYMSKMVSIVSLCIAVSWNIVYKKICLWQSKTSKGNEYQKLHQ